MLAAADLAQALLEGECQTGRGIELIGGIQSLAYNAVRQCMGGLADPSRALS